MNPRPAQRSLAHQLKGDLGPKAALRGPRGRAVIWNAAVVRYLDPAGLALPVSECGERDGRAPHSSGSAPGRPAASAASRSVPLAGADNLISHRKTRGRASRRMTCVGQGR